MKCIQTTLFQNASENLKGYFVPVQFLMVCWTTPNGMEMCQCQIPSKTREDSLLLPFHILSNKFDNCDGQDRLKAYVEGKRLLDH